MCAPDSLVDGYKVVAFKFDESVGKAKCPSGSRVTGCGVVPGGKEMYKEVYPLEDGTGCYCYNHYGGTCYATCLSSVEKSAVYQQQGQSTLIKACEGEPVVFGCGLQLKNLGNGDYEKYPVYRVNNYDSCLGFSHAPNSKFARMSHQIL